jgi:hypothetical protein
MTKGRSLALWVAFIILAYIFASQDWYALSMSPASGEVRLASYDGLTAYANLSPLLMLNFAAILAVSFVGGLGRKLILTLIAVTNIATLVWAATRIIAQDISGLAKQVEQMTGIAAAHGVADLTVRAEAAPWGFVSSLFATTVVVSLILVTERKWPKRSSKTEIASKAIKDEDPKDAIGIWDSQRR